VPVSAPFDVVLSLLAQLGGVLGRDRRQRPFGGDRCSEPVDAQLLVEDDRSIYGRELRHEIKRLSVFLVLSVALVYRRPLPNGLGWGIHSRRTSAINIDDFLE
jgi:hypothetical protein